MNGYVEHVFAPDRGGVVTLPTRPRVGAPGVVLTNAGLIDHVGAHRWNVEASRAFASAGFASVRFDLSGLGDRPPREDRLAFREAMLVETQSALTAFGAMAGCDAFVCMGLCSGADQSFRTAVADERVVGAILIDGYPYPTTGFRAHRVLAPLRDPQAWGRLARGGASGVLERVRRGITLTREGFDPEDPGLAVRDIPPLEQVTAEFHRLMARGVHVFALFTAGQLGSYNHEGQFWEMYPSLRGAAGLHYAYAPDVDHTFTQRAARIEWTEKLTHWLSATFAPDAAPASPAQ